MAETRTVIIDGEEWVLTRMYAGWSRRAGFWSGGLQRDEVYNTVSDYDKDETGHGRVLEYWQAAPRVAEWQDDTCYSEHPDIPGMRCLKRDDHAERTDRLHHPHQWFFGPRNQARSDPYQVKWWDRPDGTARTFVPNSGRSFHVDDDQPELLRDAKLLFYENRDKQLSAPTTPRGSLQEVGA